MMSEKKSQKQNSKNNKKRKVNDKWGIMQNSLLNKSEIKLKAIPNTSAIYKDGSEIKLVAYTINGNNYFKLRDVAEAFNIGVTWDDATKTIRIDTKSDYIAD
jgi:hypothetical protein